MNGQAASSTQATNTKPKNVQSLVKEYFKDIPVMQDIAYCESRNRQFNPDGTVFRGKVNSDDVGVMQVNTNYHLDKATDLGMDLFTTEGNMKYARYLFEKEGTVPWNSSSKCWSARSNLVAMK